jgi:hypothetical protein
LRCEVPNHGGGQLQCPLRQGRSPDSPSDGQLHFPCDQGRYCRVKREWHVVCEINIGLFSANPLQKQTRFVCYVNGHFPGTLGTADYARDVAGRQVWLSFYRQPSPLWTQSLQTSQTAQMRHDHPAKAGQVPPRTIMASELACAAPPDAHLPTPQRNTFYRGLGSKIDNLQTTSHYC